MTISEQKNYDLQYELGPANQYDEVAGKAQILSRKYKDPYLLDLSVKLADLIIKIPYNSDQFYKVISAANEIKKYLEKLKKNKITHASYILKYEDRVDNSDLEISLKEFNGNYEIDFSQIRDSHSSEVIDPLIEVMKKYCDIKDPSYSKEEKFGGDLGATNEYTYLRNSEGQIVYKGVKRNHENEREHGYFNTYYFPVSIGEEKIKQIFLELITKTKSLVKKGFVLENHTQQSVQATHERVLSELAFESKNKNYPLMDMSSITGYLDNPEDQKILETIVTRFYKTYIDDSFRAPFCNASDLMIAKNKLVSNNFVSPKILEIIDRFTKLKTLMDKNQSLLINSQDKEIIENITNFFLKIGLRKDINKTNTYQTKYPEVISQKINQIRDLENVEVINVTKEPSSVYLIKVNTPRSSYYFYVTDFFVLNEDLNPFLEYLLNNL